MKRLLSLGAIEVFVWFILLVTTFIISKGAFSINFGTGTRIQLLATEAARVLASGVLVLIWLVSWKKVADIYLRRALRERATV